MRKPLIFASDEELFGDDWPPCSTPKPPIVGAFAGSGDPPVITIIAPGPAVPDTDVVDPPPATVKPIDPKLAAVMDEELDLQHELVELNTIRNGNRAAMEEKLYELHKVMAGAGRDGQFSAFLRDKLGWVERPYDKAMRWIAAYERRTGKITEADYKKKMGNGKKSTTSRGTSAPTSSASFALPPLHQEFEEAEDEVDDIAPITFSAEEVEADARSVEQRERTFIHSVLRRHVFPMGQHSWQQAVMKVQQRRYGAKTYDETLFKVIMIGKKPAADDEWLGVEFDEECARIGMNPDLALEPEREDEDAYDPTAEEDELQYERDLQEERHEAEEAARAFEREETRDAVKVYVHACPEEDEACIASPLAGSNNYLVEDYSDLVEHN